MVRAQLLDGATGEWWLAVETADDRGRCPTCGIRSVGDGPRGQALASLDANVRGPR